MTFAELLDYLGARFDVLDGDAAQTVDKALAGTHREPLAGQIIADMFRKSGLADVNGEIMRAAAITALGPIRLAFMKDDAPVEGFRLVERIVHAIDGAFNEEALRLKASKLG